MSIEQPEKPKSELDFFATELNLSPEEMTERKDFADGLKEKIDSAFPMIAEKENKDKKEIEKEETEKRECLNECNEQIKNFLERYKEDDEIKILIPLKASKETVSILRNNIIRILFENESEEKKYDIKEVISEALTNAFTHCCKEKSEYAALSIKKEGGHIIEVTTMNFSEEEIPEEMLSFLNKPKEEAKEALESFSNNDVEKTINGEEFDLEKELNGLYKRRGLEIIAQLIKEIRYNKIEAGELGFCNKFTFEM